MKLPEIDYGSRADLVAPNINLPGAVARTKIASIEGGARQAIIGAERDIQMWGQIADVSKAAVQTGVNIQQDFMAREAQFQVDQYAIKQGSRISEYLKQKGPKTEYTQDEIPEEIKTKHNIPPNQPKIPAYLVDPDMQRLYMQKFIQEDAEIIQNPRVRYDAIQAANEKEAKVYEGNVKASIIAQPIYHKTKAVQQSAMLEEQGLFAEAISVWQNAHAVPEEFREAEERRLMNEWQYTELVNVAGLPLVTEEGNINPETITVLNNELEKMNNRDPNTVSALTEPQFEHHRSALQRRLREANTLTGNMKKSSDKWEVYQANQQLDQANKGRISNPTEYGKSINFLHTKQPGQTEGQYLSNVILADKMMLASQSVQTMEVVNSSAIPQKRMYLEDIDRKLEDPTLSPGDMVVYEQLKEDTTRAISEQTADPVKYAREHNLAPVIPFNYQDVQRSIANVADVERAVEAQSGQSGQFMEDDTYKQMSSHIDTLGVEGKAKFLGDVWAGLDGDGDKMAQFFEPFKKLGSNTTFAIAGQRYAMGDKITAEMIVQGEALLKEQPELASKIGIELDQLLTTEVAGAFGSNRLEQGAIRDAVKAVYATLNPGDLESDASSGASKKRLGEALQAVTGGMVNYGGIQFAAPTPALSDQRRLDNFMDEITPAYFTALSPKYNKTDVLTKVQNGDIVLVPEGHNQFYLKVLASDTLVPNEFGDGYVFSFHKPDTTVSAEQLPKTRQGEFEAAEDRIIEIEQNKKDLEIFQSQVGKVTSWIKTAPLKLKEMMEEGVEKARSKPK